MLRFSFVLFSFILFVPAFGQRIITRTDAVDLAFKNQANLRASQLGIQQQEQLLSGAAGLKNPEVFVEASPYEALVFGVQQEFSLPTVYRNRKALQEQRIQLAKLQLQGSQYELKRDVNLLYLQLQYLAQKIRILSIHDSIYQAIKVSSQRFFEAGQINKLEELTATTQADKVRNELERTKADLEGELYIFQYLTGTQPPFQLEDIEVAPQLLVTDTLSAGIQQRIAEQEIELARQELKVQRTENLPEISAGLLFPTTKEYERPIGFEVGVSIPLWRKQNRSRLAAGETGVQIALAERDLFIQRLNARYRQAVNNANKEWQSLQFYNTTALPQARNIIETSQRLFQGGELNYIESLRNLITAFDIEIDHLETHRAYNEAIIELNYLKGTL